MLLRIALEFINGNLSSTHPDSQMKLIDDLYMNATLLNTYDDYIPDEKMYQDFNNTMRSIVRGKTLYDILKIAYKMTIKHIPLYLNICDIDRYIEKNSLDEVEYYVQRKYYESTSSMNLDESLNYVSMNILKYTKILFVDRFFALDILDSKSRKQLEFFNYSKEDLYTTQFMIDKNRKDMKILDELYSSVKSV